MKENSIEEDIKIVENLLQTAHVDNEEYYKQIEIGDITFNAIKNIVSDYNKVVSELKKYKNMYEAEHEIYTIRNEQLERKENSIKGDRFNMSRIDNIERDVHLLESYAGMTHKMTDNQGRPKLDQAIERVLLDYKRVLKINEVLLKENEILKEEKEQAWEEWNNLERGSYETEQKLKQQIKELQKKNDELKKLMAHKNWYTQKLEEDLFENASNYVIKKQKVKDKIEELNQYYKKEIYPNLYQWCDITITEHYDKMIELLQELIEEREKKIK